MYNIPMPVSTIRTRMRQEFEKNRFVNKIPVVDVLLLKNNTEYQVRLPQLPGNRTPPFAGPHAGRPGRTALIWLALQETMNFWKQTTHVMSYFKEENFRGDKRLPSNFMEGFLEVS